MVVGASFKRNLQGKTMLDLPWWHEDLVFSSDETPAVSGVANLETLAG